MKTLNLLAGVLIAFGQPLFSVDYEKQIRPILEANCIDCHGPDKQKSRLRVDQRPLLLRGGDSGLSAIAPGSPDKSRLIELIKEHDPDERMPNKGDPLTSNQIALLEKWTGNPDGKASDRVTQAVLSEINASRGYDSAGV